MLLKIGIIASILVVGGIVFSSEIQTIFPNTSATAAESLEADVTSLTSKTFDAAEEKIESSYDTVETKFTEISQQTIQSAESTINSSAEKVETKFTEFKENSTEYVEETFTDNFSFLNFEE